MPLPRALRDQMVGFMRALAPVPDAELEYLSAHVGLVEVEAGSAFIAAGGPATRVGLVVSGLLRKYYVDERGREYTRSFARAGDLAGSYASMLQMVPATITVEAVQTATLIVLEHDLIAELYRRHPAWQQVGRLIAESQFIEREQREYELLCLSAASRFERLLQRERSLLQQVPQYVIASYIGVTPVHLSRIRAARLRSGSDAEEASEE